MLIRRLGCVLTVMMPVLHAPEEKSATAQLVSTATSTETPHTAA